MRALRKRRVDQHLIFPSLNKPQPGKRGSEPILENRKMRYSYISPPHLHVFKFEGYNVICLQIERHNHTQSQKKAQCSAKSERESKTQSSSSNPNTKQTTECQ